MAQRMARPFVVLLLLALALFPGSATPARAQQPVCREQTVIMLSASWCSFCRQARRFFNEHDVEFTEIDVEKTDDATVRGMYRANGVPTIFIGSDQIVGFDEAKLRDMLCIED